MATIGFVSRSEPVEPKKPASPKANTPPSAATNQYPLAGLSGGHGHNRAVERLPAHRPVERRRPEGEDAAVGRRQPRPPVGRGRRGRPAHERERGGRPGRDRGGQRGRDGGQGTEPGEESPDTAHGGTRHTKSGFAP